ncbi:unnamed protein product [Amoebophrya sp. A25]|nr:unnamed protein product [Amoebophrya sp. A25]|eukprot:GSA25T00024147001.1
MGGKILVAKLRGVKTRARGRQIVKKLGRREVTSINVCTDLGRPINYDAVACVLQDERFVVKVKDPNAENRWGILHHAARDGNKEICDLALQRGDFKCGTAVTDAAKIAEEAGHAELADFLRGSAKRERLAKFFATKSAVPARTALKALKDRNELKPDILCNFGLAEKLKSVTANALLDSASAKEFVLAKDEDNWTMLHWAVFKNDEALVERIVEHDLERSCSNINKKNHSGHSPLSLAVSSGQYRVANLIQRSRQFVFPENPDSELVPDKASAQVFVSHWLPRWKLKACSNKKECAKLVKQLTSVSSIAVAQDFGFHEVNYTAIRALLKFAGGNNDLDINAFSCGYDLLRHAVIDGEPDVVGMLVATKRLDDFKQIYSCKCERRNILHICAARKSTPDITLRLLEALFVHPSAMTALCATDDSDKTPKEVARAVRGEESPVYKFLHEKDTIHKLAQTSDVGECRRIVKSLTESLTEPLQCKICLKDNVGVALSCGHQLCATCVDKIAEQRGPGGLEKCPFCRKVVTSKINLFFN